MHEKTGNLIQIILGLPIFRSEWVLYLLLFLSLASIGVMLERWVFFRRRTLDSAQVRDALAKMLDKGDFEGAAGLLKKHDCLETNVVLVGLQAAELGPEPSSDGVTVVRGPGVVNASVDDGEGPRDHRRSELRISDPLQRCCVPAQYDAVA